MLIRTFGGGIEIANYGSVFPKYIPLSWLRNTGVAGSNPDFLPGAVPVLAYLQ